MSVPHSRLAKHCLTHAATVLVGPSGYGWIPEMGCERVVVELAATTPSILKTTCRLARIRKHEDSGSTPVPGVVLGVRAEHKCDWLRRRLHYCRQDQCAGSLDVFVQCHVRRGRRTITREDACAPQVDTAPPTALQLQEPLCALFVEALVPRACERRRSGSRRTASTTKAARCLLESEPAPGGWLANSGQGKLNTSGPRHIHRARHLIS
jgi:hypothetical protein